MRVVGRYNDAQGSQLAGSVTYFGFLSLFPLVAIAFAVVGQIVRVYPDARAQLETFLQDNLPGLTGPDGIDLDTIADAGGARVSAGVIGALGLIYAGLGCVDALRQALRHMWAVAPEDGNLVVKKLKDVAVLVVLGGTILVTTAGSSIATSATTWVLELLDLGTGGVTSFLLQVLAIALAVVANTLVLIVVFARLPGHKLPWRNVWTGALLGAVGIEILKQLATLILSSTSSNPIYGAFAGLVTVLVWINFICRVVLYAAAWSVTGPVPTVEAEIAARGETLDAATADAVERARQAHDDAAVVPLDEEHRTTAGTVALTTTGIVERPSSPAAAEARSRAGLAGWVLALLALVVRAMSARRPRRGD